MDFVTFQMQVFAYLKFEISVFRLNAKSIARYQDGFCITATGKWAEI